MEEKLHLSSQYIRQTSFLLSHDRGSSEMRSCFCSGRTWTDRLADKTLSLLSSSRWPPENPILFSNGILLLSSQRTKDSNWMHFRFHSHPPNALPLSMKTKCTPLHTAGSIHGKAEKKFFFKWVANLLLAKRINGRYILILVLKQFQDFTDHYKRSPINLIVRYDWCQFGFYVLAHFFLWVVPLNLPCRE